MIIHQNSVHYELYYIGYKRGSALFKNLSTAILSDPEYENRIIFLTDAMPNTGNIGDDYLFGLTNKNANGQDYRIYSTFIGMGIDFNTDLIETITKIRGANYYAVHSTKDFLKRMDDEFEFMVTPMVFDLELTLISDDNSFEIDEVYGSPESDQSTGSIMKVNTLFPSASNDNEEVKGGITLLKLKKNKDIAMNIANLQLMASYEDRDGEKHSHKVSILFSDPKHDEDKFENTGIRKAVLLSRYVKLIKEWINEQSGTAARNQWERTSTTLKVDEKYKEYFSDFRVHFIKEMGVLADGTLNQELDILDKLTNYTI